MVRRSKHIVVGVIATIVLLIVVLIALPFLLNPSYFKDMAYQYMQQTLGHHVSVGRTDLSLFPYPQVEVSEVIVKERPDTHAFFRATSISLDLKISSLLRQEFSVKKLQIDHPEIEIKRDREGEWWMFQPSPSEAEGSILAGLPFIQTIVIANGRITVIDESPREEARGIVFEAVNLSLDATASSMYSARVDASAKIRQAQGASDFVWEGLVEFRSTATNQEGEAVPSTSPIFKMDGMVSVKDIDVRQLTEFFYLESFVADELGIANIEGHMNVMPGQVGYDLNLSNLSLTSQAASFSGNANVSGFTAGDLTMFVSVQSTPIPLKTLQRLVPSHTLPIAFKSHWQESEVGGTVQVMKATIAGSTHPGVDVSIVGTFQLDQGVWKSKSGSPTVEDVRGTIVVEPDRIRFTEMTGIYEALPIQAANGLILFKESGPWLEIDLHSHVLAKRMIEVFSHLPSFESTNPYLTRFTILDGVGDLRLKFAGLLDGVEGVTFQSGGYQFSDLHLRVDELRDSVSIPEGKIEFTPKELKFHEVNGTIAESLVRVHGTIQIAQRPVFERFNVSAVLRDDVLRQIVGPSTSLAPVGISGKVSIHAMFSGLVTNPSIKGEFDLLESTLNLSGLIHKPPGVASTLKFDLEIGEESLFTVKHAELAVLPLRLTAQAKVRWRPNPDFHVRANTGQINLGLLPEGVIIGEKFLRSGILEVSLNLRGRGSDWREWRPKGWVALTEGVLDVKDLQAPITNLFLRLKLNPTIAEFKRFECKIQNSDLHVMGTVKHWKSKPEVDLVLESSRFDLDLLIPKGDQSSLRGLLENLAAESKVVGNIHIARSEYKMLKAENLSSVLKIRDGLVTLDRIRGQAYGEPIAGRVFIHLPQHKSPAIRSSFHLQGLPFDDLHRTFGYEDRLITGKVSIRGMIQGHGRNPRGVIPTLNGNMDVVIEDGHVRKGTVLPRILAILNLPAVLGKQVDIQKKGFPFEKTAATLQVQDGIITSKNVVLDSPIMKMTTAGEYDLVNDQLDMVAAVSPFGRYSEFLKSIPLFGRILAGDRKGIATALFDIQGSLTEPDVRYRPLRSFATGLTGLSQLAFDLLKNTIRLPADLIKPDSDRAREQDSEGTKRGELPTLP